MNTYLVSFSYIEIYNENVYDLLSNFSKNAEPLQVSEDPNKGFYIRNIIEK